MPNKFTILRILYNQDQFTFKCSVFEVNFLCDEAGDCGKGEPVGLSFSHHDLLTIVQDRTRTLQAIAQVAYDSAECNTTQLVTTEDGTIDF